MQENVEDIAKLEKQTVPLGNKTPLMTVSSEQTNNIQTGTDDDEKKCIDSVQVITNAVRPSPSLTPSLDPELLKRLEAEDTPRRILRASTIAVTKRSLERKQSAHKKQKRKAENKDVKEPRRKIKKKSKVIILTKYTKLIFYSGFFFHVCQVGLLSNYPKLVVF